MAAAGDNDPQGREARGLRRLQRDYARLDGLDLYARVVERTGSAIHDEGRIDGALSTVRRGLVDATSRASTLHGWRTQALFEAMVASLGSVRLLKFEDAGDVFFSGEDIRPPDFRVVAGDRQQMLIEVKNFYQARPHDDFRMRLRDLTALQRYAELVSVDELKVAIYWSRWNIWTLTDTSRFRTEGSDHVTISLPEAAKANEMLVLGDRMLATESPIGLTLFTDPTSPRRVGEDGSASFTIGAAEYSVAGRVVTDSAEQQIVHRLIMYGGWQEEALSEVVDGEVMSVSFMFSPEEAPGEGQFAMHGHLSSLYSAMFNDATLGDEGEITELRIEIDPGALADLIPDDYQGTVLRIWRFLIHPS